MANPKFDREQAARVIAEAVAAGDRATCEKHGITIRTLQRWRKRLGADPLLSQAVAEKRAVVEADWASSLPTAIRKSIEFLERATETCEAGDPEAVHAIAGAMKLLTDVALARQMLDVRLARQAGQARATNESAAGPGGNVVAIRPAAGSSAT